MSDLLAALSGVKTSGAGWTAKCPAHEDRRASLSIGQGDDGRWLLKCHAGCATDAILSAINLERRDLFPNTDARQRPVIAAEYDYTDEDGEILYQSVRLEPKDFRQRRPNGHGRWDWTLGDVRRVLYRLHTLKGRKTVFIAEGEKDSNRLAELGLTSTTNVGGALKWRDAYTEQLTAAGVSQAVVIPDNDTPGLTHGRAVAASCHAAGIKTKLVPLPVAAKGDVSDYLSDHERDDLLALVKAAPVFTPDGTVVPGPVVTTLADVTAEPVRWSWPGRIARGKLNLLAGEPGEGKSTMTLDLAARITRPDASMPDGVPAPDGSVLLLSAEDGLRDTIRPRLDACGADLQRVHALTATRDLDGTERALELGRDLPQLEVAIERYAPALVVIDPLSAYLGRADTWRDSEVRSLLSPLASLAERNDCAVLGVLHLNKSVSSRVLHRIMGSIGFVAAARIVLAVARDPDDDTRRLLLPAKNNLAPPAETLAFRLEDGRMVWEDGPVKGVTADSVLGESTVDRSERRDAEAFLRELLADGEPMSASDVLKAAKSNGISERTLRRTKSRLHVRSKLVGFGRDGQWQWWLPVSLQSEVAQVCPREVAASGGEQAKNPLFSQRRPETATSLEMAVSDGNLCVSRDCQETAIHGVATSEETLTKHTETEEAANGVIGEFLI
jgi:hypothetical protein